MIVVHDYDADTAERIIGGHPLAQRGLVSQLSIEPGSGSPARQRNLGWRSARGRLIAFTDDDCRPEPGWLTALTSESDGPGVVVQGRTRPEPHEAAILAAPHVRTLSIEPVGPYCQTANMLYPRAILEQLGGFDEVAVSGEDVGLSLRARAAGAKIVAAPEAVVNHAVESHSLPGILQQNLKWRHLAYLVSRHPEFRRELHLGIFWDDEHLLVLLATAGLLAAPFDRRWLALAAPYAARQAGRRGRGARARLLAGAEAPGQLIRQLAEVAGMAVGSVQHRTILL